MVPVGLFSALKQLQESKALPACITSLVGQLIIPYDPRVVIRVNVGGYAKQNGRTSHDRLLIFQSLVDTVESFLKENEERWSATTRNSDGSPSGISSLIKYDYTERDLPSGFLRVTLNDGTKGLATYPFLDKHAFYTTGLHCASTYSDSQVRMAELLYARVLFREYFCVGAGNC